MKPSHRLQRRRRQRGSILVICLVVAGLGTIGAAAFFSLIQAKSQESNERETALVRRTRLANSRILAREALLRLDLGSPTAPSGGARTFTLGGGWGKAEISSHALVPLSDRTAFRLHKTGATSHRAFTSDISVTLDDGNSTFTYQAQAKSWHPALGGDLLTAQRPTGGGSGPTQFTGNLRVKGRAVFHGATYSTTPSPLRADRVLTALSTGPALSFLNTAGNAILPENAILPPTTAGPVSGAVDYTGRVNLTGNPDSAVNDYADTVARLGGATFAGQTPFLSSSGPTTNPPNSGDPGAMEVINATNSPFPPAFATVMRAHRPLSSAVMSALLAKATLADSAVVTAILLDNKTLPTDVLNLVVTSTSPLTPSDRWNVIRNSPVGVANDGAGTLYVDLDDPSATSISVTDAIGRLILRGQETGADYANSAGLAPVIIAIQDASAGPGTLNALQFEGQNNRPFILAISSKGNFRTVTATVTHSSGFPSWRSLLELEGIALNFETSSVSAATLVGGIRTDRSLNVASGTLTVDRETDTAAINALLTMACRQAWLEFVRIP